MCSVIVITVCCGSAPCGSAPDTGEVDRLTYSNPSLGTLTNIGHFPKLGPRIPDVLVRFKGTQIRLMQFSIVLITITDWIFFWTQILPFQIIRKYLREEIAVIFEFRFLTLLKPTGYVMHQQFNIQQLYVPPTQYLCVLYLSENKQRLVPLTA